MKKILFLLLLSVSIYGQTYQNPTFGTVTTKTSPTVTNDPYLTTTGTTGVQGKIAPVNVLIPYTPINYTISGQTIGQQIAAIDAKIGTMGTTSAGVTQRVYFTADNTTVNSVVYFASSLSGKGSTASGSPPALVLADNTKAYFTKDVISIAQPAPTIGYAGTYSGNLTVSASPTPVATQQRFTVEIYRTDNLGVPIASGVSGAPVGDLGVTVLAILDSGIINLTAGAITNIAVSGVLTQNITLNTGERLRYHVSAAKIGIGGGNVTFGVYYGTSYNSYYDVPVAITTDAVLNKSAVLGAITNTDALNTLNTDKVSSGGSGVNGRVSFWTGTNTQSSDANLFWDNSLKVLGIGQTAPAVALDISGTTFAGTQLRTTTVSNTDNPVLAFRRSRASTTALQANDVIGGISWRGHDGTSYGSNVAAINVITPQNYTGSVKPAYMTFQVTPNNSSTPILPMSINGESINIDYNIPNPVNLQSSFFVTVQSKGDNTTFKGTTASTFLAKDRTDVTALNKGVLIGVQASVAPQIARNNVPFDDVNGVFIDNSGTAKATDAIYTARNTGIVGSEWSTLWSSDANTDYGIRLMGVHALQYLNFGNKLTVDKDGLINNSILTASRVITTDASKNFVSSTTTSTELGYLSGVTSALQTQLNGKLNNSGNESFTGVKSSTNTGATNINGFNFTNNGTSGTSSVVYTNASSGRSESGTNSSTGIFKVLDNTSSGIGYVLNSATGSTGDLMQFRKNSVNTTVIDQNGIITTPTPTAGDNTTRVATTAFLANAVSSGSYTPTLTATANCSALTLTSAFYQKVGNIVSVSILARGTTTSANAITSFTATLPINKATITAIQNGSFNLGFSANSDMAMGYCSVGQTTVSCTSSTLNSSGSNAYFIINFSYDVTQ